MQVELRPLPAKIEVRLPATDRSAADAEVFIDAVPAGRVPGTLETEGGDHLIEARKPGFQVESISVSVQPGTTKVVWLKLTPTPQALPAPSDGGVPAEAQRPNLEDKGPPQSPGPTNKPVEWPLDPSPRKDTDAQGQPQADQAPAARPPDAPDVPAPSSAAPKAPPDKPAAPTTQPRPPTPPHPQMPRTAAYTLAEGTRLRGLLRERAARQERLRQAFSQSAEALGAGIVAVDAGAGYPYVGLRLLVGAAKRGHGGLDVGLGVRSIYLYQSQFDAELSLRVMAANSRRVSFGLQGGGSLGYSCRGLQATVDGGVALTLKLGQRVRLTGRPYLQYAWDRYCQLDAPAERRQNALQLALQGSLEAALNTYVVLWGMVEGRLLDPRDAFSAEFAPIFAGSLLQDSPRVHFRLGLTLRM